MSEKRHICEDTRNRAAKLLELMKKRPSKRTINAIALELAHHDEMLLGRAMIRIERELTAAMSEPELDVLSPFGELVIALDRRMLLIARRQHGSVPVKTRRRTERKTKHG